MAKLKNKTIENVTFNSEYVKGMSREEFMEAHKGIYEKNFAGYPDQKERAEKQLAEAWEILSPAEKVEASTLVAGSPADENTRAEKISVMDSPGEGSQENTGEKGSRKGK